MNTSSSIFSSRKGYLLALGAALIGICLMVFQMWKLYGNVSAFPRFTVPGETTVELAAGEYILYAEPLSGSIISNISATCGGLDAGEKKVELSTPTAKTTYELGQYYGVSLFAASVATYLFIKTRRRRKRDQAVAA